MEKVREGVKIKEFLKNKMKGQVEQKRITKRGGGKGGRGGREMDREKGEMKDEGIELMLTSIICGHNIVNGVYFRNGRIVISFLG